MSLVSDDFYNKKLEKNKINIKTKYIVKNKMYERNTDGSTTDDVKEGMIFSKEYYQNGILKHVEKEFDLRMKYTFIDSNIENDDYKCKNCGFKAKLKDFVDGCPYCGTSYNIDYFDSELGSKNNYDRVLRSNLYRILTAIADLIISIIIAYFFIKFTSRTFNNVDIYKVFIYGAILAVVLYYFFYLYDAYLVLGPIKKYKDKQNQKQIEFWKETKVDKVKYFNNLNYELRKYFYGQRDIIDYDILDYIDFRNYQENDKNYIEATVEIRIIYFVDNKIKAKITKEKYKMVKNEEGITEIHGGSNMIKCKNCGSSINVSDSKCKYCNTPIKYLQEWILFNK